MTFSAEIYRPIVIVKIVKLMNIVLKYNYERIIFYFNIVTSLFDGVMKMK